MFNVKLPLIDEMVSPRIGFHTLSDGKRMRFAVLDPANVPHGTVLVAAGRREFIEKKFAEVGRDFLDRGFRVICFEWRGQGLSDRMLTGAERQRDHIVDFAIHMEDLHSLFAAIVQPNLIGSLIFCGHSMGSHLLMRWLMENPSMPVTAVILTAPMFALAGHVAHGTSNLISWGMMKIGHATDYAAVQHDYGEHERRFDKNPLSHDPARFSIMEKYFMTYPDMVVGGVTWGWLHAATKSMHFVQQRENLERVTLPVLTILGSKDRVTPPGENKRYLAFLPNAEHVQIDGALHDVMNEIETYRTEAWRHIDGFLKRVIV
jgi:lysophospholipase